MKAGIITAAGKAPVYGDFNEPVAGERQELVTVSAYALACANREMKRDFFGMNGVRGFVGPIVSDKRAGALGPMALPPIESQG